MARQRDKLGRFVRGHAGGPGRPPAAKEAEYWAVAKTTCSLDDWRAVVAQAVTDAKSGDTAARKFVSEIMIGDPLRLRARDDAPKTTPAASAADVAALLAAELADVGKLPNDARRAAMVARLGDSLLRAFETTDMAETMQRIETALKELKQ